MGTSFLFNMPVNNTDIIMRRFLKLISASDAQWQSVFDVLPLANWFLSLTFFSIAVVSWVWCSIDGTSWLFAGWIKRWLKHMAHECIFIPVKEVEFATGGVIVMSGHGFRSSCVDRRQLWNDSFSFHQTCCHVNMWKWRWYDEREQRERERRKEKRGRERGGVREREEGTERVGEMRGDGERRWREKRGKRGREIERRFGNN